jgi:diguanylate cyclase (GGDEF)-like protein
MIDQRDTRQAQRARAAKPGSGSRLAQSLVARFAAQSAVAVVALGLLLGAVVSADSRRGVLLAVVAGGLAALWTALVAAVARASAQLRRESGTDSLTGLPNRDRFSDVLREQCAAGPVAVMVVDVDDFKRVNDTFGHDVGDHVVRAVAGRLRRAVRSEDVVARLGGDEFGVVLTDADDATLRAVSERILDAVAEPMAAGGQVLRVAVSVGVATGRAGADPDELVRRADLAMYAAKREGGARKAFAAAA